MNNPTPIIEKIVLNDQQKQDIKNILEGKPTEKQLKLWKDRGLPIRENYNAGCLEVY